MRRNIIITGGSNGIGLELVKYFLNKDYYIYTSYNKSNRNLVELKKKYKNKLYFTKLDLQDQIKIKSFISKIKKFSVKFDMLILNAIYNVKRKPFKHIKLEEYNKIFASNFFSNILLLKGFSGYFKNKSFKIIHISSLVSKQGSWGLSSYGPFKAAIDNLFKCLNFEYKSLAKFKSVYLGAVNTKGYKFTNGKRKNKKIISVEKARLKILKKL